jgi:hypothetical protein
MALGLHDFRVTETALADNNTKSTKQTFRLAVPRKRQAWLEGLWAHAGGR